MKIINDNYIKKLYSGWLGKSIGVRYGAPIEMWSSEDIKAKYPDKDGYLFDYPVFGADDDTNGPIFFSRALEDAIDLKNLTAEDFSNAWLNYVPYLHGFFWWGGYRISTEHTAYLNLKNGIKPPQSGSIDENTQVVAEQIGGQIFSDIWGFVCPNDFEKAADLSKMSSQVSHDGDGVYGGMFIAACISSAFKATSISEIISDGLSVIPEQSSYYQMAKDLIAFYQEHPNDVDQAFAYIRKHYWKENYPGNCHIIPNAAIIVYSLLYGDGDFDKTLKIANYSGFDTDCNVGNLGAIMGVYCGLEKINYQKWRAPINDVLLCSSTLGHENIVDIPSLVYRNARMALMLRDETYEGKYFDSLMRKNHLCFDFLLPGSTHGLKSSDPNLSFQNEEERLVAHEVKAMTHIYYKTFYAKEDLYDNRYDTSMSSRVMPGQTMIVKCRAEEKTDVKLFYKDQHTQTRYYSEAQVVFGLTELRFKLDLVRDALISEIGLFVGDSCKRLQIERFEVEGKPRFDLNFEKERIEDYTPTHQEISGTVYWHGKWELSEGLLQGSSDDTHGEIYFGIKMQDFSVKNKFQLNTEGKAGILFRVQGASRSYGAFIDGKTLSLEKNHYQYQILHQVDLKIDLNQWVKIEVIVKKNRIKVLVNDQEMISYLDPKPYYEGCVGAYISANSSARYNKFQINEGEDNEEMV